MDIKKLKLLALGIIIIIVLILFFYTAEDDKIIVEEQAIKPNEISTDEISVDISNVELEEDENYINLSPAEKEEYINRYGKEYVLFTDQGVVIESSEFDLYQGKKLLTNIWPTTDFTDRVSEPKLGELKKVIVSDTYVLVKLQNVTDDEVDEYIDEMKKIYKKDLESVDDKKIFYKQNEEGIKLKVRYGEKDGEIEVIFYF